MENTQADDEHIMWPKNPEDYKMFTDLYIRAVGDDFKGGCSEYPDQGMECTFVDDLGDDKRETMQIIRIIINSYDTIEKARAGYEYGISQFSGTPDEDTPYVVQTEDYILTFQVHRKSVIYIEEQGVNKSGSDKYMATSRQIIDIMSGT